jgi:general secretion pathway protein M
MSVAARIERALTASPAVAAALYGAMIVLLLVIAWTALADLHNRAGAASDTAALLDQLRGRKAVAAAENGPMKGSPFLDGPSVTMAGAALLQRVSNAVSSAGGTIQSSQVEVTGNPSGTVRLVMSTELDLNGLQRLLYDLEAGMPFLFVEQLDVQAPQTAGAAAAASAGRMHVQLAVAGEWRGAAK